MGSAGGVEGGLLRGYVADAGVLVTEGCLGALLRPQSEPRATFLCPFCGPRSLFYLAPPQPYYCRSSLEHINDPCVNDLGTSCA
jgi:hypothetical protein